MSARLGIGGNAPPLAERLEIDHASLAAQALEAAALLPGELKPIGDDDEAGAYAETAKALKGVAALVEAARKKEKDGILKDGRTVDAFFQTMAGPLTAGVSAVVSALNVYQRAKIEAQRKADAEAAERARKEAIAFDEPAPVVAPVVVKEAARVTSFTGAMATASRKWKGEVTDPNAVPRQYLMVNQSAIDAAIKGGMREIPGVRIFEDVRTAIR